ncbi:MAG: serine/threonine protein kinase, partial [Myxococcales bacterium]|nr:serine/threonine protein kinase [Myxococcales bacterium]
MTLDPTASEWLCPVCDRAYDAPGACDDDGATLLEIAAEAAEPAPTTLAGRFTVHERLSEGGMGAVYRATQTSMGRPVALKIMHGRLSQDAAAARRFIREARLASHIAHPNVVSVIDFGQDPDGTLFLAMELLAGPTLAELLAREGPFDAARTVRIGVQIADALDAAHKRGIIHRDLKPGNVIVVDPTPGRDALKVVDFGLAKATDGDHTTLTGPGQIFGTPAYMSPEQARGDLDEIDEQSDVYALGAVLYQILSGRAPFEGPVAGLIIQQVLHSKPLRLSAVSPDCPPELEALVEHGMAKDKSERLKSALEFASEVKAYRDGRTLQSYSYSARELAWRWVARHKRSVITGVVVFYLLVAGAVYHYAQLRQEKAAVEEQKSEAEQATMNAELAFRDARAAEAEARVARKKAEVERAAAKDETAEKERALQGWDMTLADAYAMRIRLAREQHDHNGALSFAAAALQAAEHPEARGTPLSTPELHPLLWNLQPDKASKQEFYQFFDVNFSADGRFV